MRQAVSQRGRSYGCLWRQAETGLAFRLWSVVTTDGFPQQDANAPDQGGGEVSAAANPEENRVCSGHRRSQCTFLLRPGELTSGTVISQGEKARTASPQHVTAGCIHSLALAPAKWSLVAVQFEH